MRRRSSADCVFSRQGEPGIISDQETDMEVAIDISAITKRYENFILQGVSLQIPRGAIVGLIGQNGAGKTTLLNCVLNLVRKDSGSVHLPGLDQEVSAEKIRRFVGYVPERLVYYDWMTVESMLRFVSKFYDGWDDGRCRDLLAGYRLDPGRKIRDLSMGMRKKLGLVAALTHRPRVLILDEPASNLDPVARNNLLEDLRQILGTWGTRAILISSHNLTDVERLVDWIAILRAGKLQCYTSREKLLGGWRKVVFEAPVQPGWADSMPCGIHHLKPGHAVVVESTEAESLIGRLESLGGVVMKVTQPNLEEIFLRMA